jgi:hypothetical protein
MTSSRVPILTVCTLATFAGLDLPTHADPVLPAPDAESGIENLKIQADAAVVEQIAPIAAPETLTATQFTVAEPEPSAIEVEPTAISITTNQAKEPSRSSPPHPNAISVTSASVTSVAPPEVLPVSERAPSNATLKSKLETQRSLTDSSIAHAEIARTPNSKLQTPNSTPKTPIPETLLAQSPEQTEVAASFTDIQGHWAQAFIEYLASREIVRGFPDRTFRPDLPIHRSQLASMLQKALPSEQGSNLTAIEFTDVSLNHWAYDAIQTAYRRGFLSKYPDNTFKPAQPLSRSQVIAALTQGLNLVATNEKPENLATYFQDADDIPDYNRSAIVAAVENRLIVNYPDIQRLNANQAATRADAAAFIYQTLVKLGQAPALAPTTMAARYIVAPLAVAATPPDNPPLPDEAAPATTTVQDVQNRLQAVQSEPLFGDIFGGSPGITVANPSGFGADNLTGFASATYQESVRGSEKDDGSLGFGIGFGDAQKVVGVELGYTIASFGSNRDFGTGGFNLKIHRRLATDTSIAVGWNGFLNIGDENDFEDSLYGVVTQVFRTRKNINDPFSRVAVSAGLGNGQFRTVEDIEDDRGTVNPFGSVALRIARPVSFITEWTGQDLALGLSISPFKNFNLVITPALRDVLGEGDRARFVLGVGTSFKF